MHLYFEFWWGTTVELSLNRHFWIQLFKYQWVFISIINLSFQKWNLGKGKLIRGLWLKVTTHGIQHLTELLVLTSKPSFQDPCMLTRRLYPRAPTPHEGTNHEFCHVGKNVSVLILRPASKNCCCWDFMPKPRPHRERWADYCSTIQHRLTPVELLYHSLIKPHTGQLSSEH